MTHTICKSVEREELDYLQQLWSTMLEPELDLGSKLEQLFAMETDAFGLEHGFLSRIDPEQGTQRFAVTFGPHGRIARGKTVPIDQSYCRRTIEEPDGTFVLDDALAEGWGDDPAYATFELGSYLGTTVAVEDELYGTLCFANTEPRDEPITDEEIDLVQMHANWVSYELNQWSRHSSLDTLGRSIGETEVPSPRVDSMMDILSREARRFVLLTLLDEDGETSLDVIRESLDSERVAIQLHHTHLPKLEQAGYIEWNPGANHITRGPKFEEIEPMLCLLEEYTTGFVV